MPGEHAPVPGRPSFVDSQLASQQDEKIVITNFESPVEKKANLSRSVNTREQIQSGLRDPINSNASIITRSGRTVKIPVKFEDYMCNAVESDHGNGRYSMLTMV